MQAALNVSTDSVLVFVLALAEATTDGPPLLAAVA